MTDVTSNVPFAAVLRGCDRFADEARLNTTRALLTVVAGGGAVLARGTLTSLCGNESRYRSASGENARMAFPEAVL